MNQGCCSALIMGGPSTETVVVVPFRRQLKRDLRPKPDSRLVPVPSPILHGFLKGYCSCGRMKRDGRKHQTPHRQCTVASPFSE